MSGRGPGLETETASSSEARRESCAFVDHQQVAGFEETGKLTKRMVCVAF
jgi:hypothetical protein